MAGKKKSFLKRFETTLLTTKSETLHVGFSKLNMWVSTGSYAINRLMSGRFDYGLLFGRNYVYYGESGSGKSLQAAYVAANAQRDLNADVIWIDTEKATDDIVGQKWLLRAGLDLDKLSYISGATIADISEMISGATMLYRKSVKEKEKLDPLVIIVDSWSSSITDSQWDQAKKGKPKGDQGQHAKQTGDLIKKTTHLVHGLPILTVGVAHVYDSQELYGRKHKTSGGHKMIFLASGCLLLTKKELKDEDVEDQDVLANYKKISDKWDSAFKKKKGKGILGITCIVENLKSRVSKPFEKIEVQIPWETGMDPLSGLFELLWSEGAITKASAGWYSYKTAGGKTKKFQKGSFRELADDIMRSADVDISDVSDEEENDDSNE